MGSFLFFIFSCWGMPVLTWLRKSAQIRHGLQAGSPRIAVRQLVPRLSPASVPGPSADCTILPEQVGGRGAEARRWLLGEHRTGKMRSRGRQRPPLPLRCRRLGEGAENGGGPREGFSAGRTGEESRGRCGGLLLGPNHHGVVCGFNSSRGIKRN